MQKHLTTLALVLFYSFKLLANPVCLSKNGKELPIDNAQVLQWKRVTANQFAAHAHVRGILLKTFADTAGHKHFEIMIGELTEETLEVVFNTGFGILPELVPGMIVEACGDYVTSIAATSQYPSSPDGAIIHWVHRSNNIDKHESGFLSLNGVTYGI